MSLAPFEDLPWQRFHWSPTPFSENERDRIPGWYADKRWRIPGHRKPMHWPSYLAYAYTLFFTSMRPSELSAVRVRNVDPVAGTIRVVESIDDGHIGDVKTRSADRTVRLTAENAELLAGLLSHDSAGDAFVFLNVWRQPIDAGAFYNGFIEAQRVLGIEPAHDLYSTKDTYISVCLSGSDPVNLSWLSEQTGVSESTIKKHYGRFLHHPDRDALELRKIRPPSQIRESQVPSRKISDPRLQLSLRTEDSLPDVSVRSRNWTSIGSRSGSNSSFFPEIGGDGWESNPPRTSSALIRF